MHYKKTFFCPLPLLLILCPRALLPRSLARSHSLPLPPRFEVRALSDVRCRSISPPFAPEGMWLCALFEASVCPRRPASAQRAARALV